MTIDLTEVIEAIAAKLADVHPGRGDCDHYDKARELLDVAMPLIHAQLEHEAQAAEDAHTKRMLENTMFEGMQPDGRGGVVVKLRMAMELSAAMVTAFKAMLDQAGAQNYVEQTVYDRNTGERYIVTVHRPGGQTPHELRRAAEAELARLREQMRGIARATLEAAADKLHNRVKGLPRDDQFGKHLALAAQIIAPPPDEAQFAAELAGLLGGLARREGSDA